MNKTVIFAVLLSVALLVCIDDAQGGFSMRRRRRRISKTAKEEVRQDATAEQEERLLGDLEQLLDDVQEEKRENENDAQFERSLERILEKAEGQDEE